MGAAYSSHKMMQQPKTQPSGPGVLSSVKSAIGGMFSSWNKKNKSAASDKKQQPSEAPNKDGLKEAMSVQKEMNKGM